MTVTGKVIILEKDASIKDDGNVHKYDARYFGTDSHEKALLLGLDILRDI